MANRNDNPENENLNESNNGDDNFGLPDLDYKPLETSQETTSPLSYSNEETKSTVNESETTQSYTYTPVEEPKSNAPIMIAIIIGLVLVVSGFLIYRYVYIPKAEKAKKELLAKQELERKRKEEEARLAKEKEEAERRRLEEQKAAIANTPVGGTIETLTARTGRYYVVIHSDLDDDLLMDFAKKLSAQGVSTSILPPYGKKRFYRLATTNFENFAEAQASADEAKAAYGAGIWVMKY